MILTKCLNPQTIYNKYIHQTIVVDCQKCEACKKRKNDQWAKRLMQESRCWQFCVFFTLTYNDTFCPRFDYTSSGLYLAETQERFYNRFEFKDVFLNPKDVLDFLDNETEKQYFIDYINEHGGIPHPSVRDIQNFKKRLTQNIQRHCTGKYQEYRYIICAEYGTQTFRPHYHGILFFNSEKLAEQIEGLVRQSWSIIYRGTRCPLGNVDVQFSHSKDKCCQYVSKYVTKSSDIPKVYVYPALSTFKLCSRHPPIGSLLESSSEVREIFYSCSPTRIQFCKVAEGNFQPKLFPLDKRLKDRLFPKCPLYGEISVDCRIDLYKSFFSHRGPAKDFNEFFLNIMCRAFYLPCGFEYDAGEWYLDCFTKCPRFKPWQHYEIKNSCFADMINRILHGFSSMHGIYHLYKVCRRVYIQSEVFGVSYDEYLQHIFRFYDVEFPKYQLKTFYNGMIDTLHEFPSTDYRSFYPLTFQDYDLTSTPASVVYLKDIIFKKKEQDKNHLKNDYIYSRGFLSKNPQLSNLISRYNAKKCYEDGQTVSHAW